MGHCGGIEKLVLWTEGTFKLKSGWRHPTSKRSIWSVITWELNTHNSCKQEALKVSLISQMVDANSKWCTASFHLFFICLNRKRRKQTKSLMKGLHGVYKTPLRASFPANKDPTVNSPVLFSALQQLHSPFPWQRPTWAHLGLWPWKHILKNKKDKRKVVNVHIRHEHEGKYTEDMYLSFIHSVDTKLWTNKFILKKIWFFCNLQVMWLNVIIWLF